MSGGAFNYEQHHLDMLIDEINDNLQSTAEYSPLLVGELIDCRHQLNILLIKLNLIDYAISGDTDQSDYLEKLNIKLLEYYDGLSTTKTGKEETD